MQSKIVENIPFFFIIIIFHGKIRFSISCESSARQIIHIKCQTLFSSKNKNQNVMG